MNEKAVAGVLLMIVGAFIVAASFPDPLRTGMGIVVIVIGFLGARIKDSGK